MKDSAPQGLEANSGWLVSEENCIIPVRVEKEHFGICSWPGRKHEAGV